MKSPTAAQLREALFDRNAERETNFYVLVTEQQAQDLAAGYVPNSVKAMCRTMLDWDEEERRKMDARTVKKRA